MFLLSRSRSIENLTCWLGVGYHVFADNDYGLRVFVSKDSIDEKRAHIRAPIELKVEYKKMNTFFADYTKNISKGGTFIKTDRPLPVGTEFLFRLVIPSIADPVEIKGTVIWTNSKERRDHPEIDELGMGIRFVYENDSDRSNFEQMVESMMRESLGDLLFDKLLKRD